MIRLLRPLVALALGGGTLGCMTYGAVEGLVAESFLAKREISRAEGAARIDWTANHMTPPA